MITTLYIFYIFYIINSHSLIFCFILSAGE